MSAITTHVLDTSRGRPAVGVPVTLDRRVGQDQWSRLGQGETDADGRVRTLMPGGASIDPGLYRLVFDTRRYFEALDIVTFFPSVTIVFNAAPGEAHLHVPLLLSPFGYSTYRGT